MTEPNQELLDFMTAAFPMLPPDLLRRTVELLPTGHSTLDRAWLGAFEYHQKKLAEIKEKLAMYTEYITIVE